MAEAKAQGFEVKAIREIVKIRAADPNDRSAFEAILELYRSALGV